LDSTPYGTSGPKTPNMQRLADSGMTFTQAYVASPTCAPSRAALLTGMMPARNGAEANHSRPKPEIKKWPAYFHDLGYEVVAFGKVSHYQHTGDYGFDYFAHDTFHDHAGIAEAVQFLKDRDGHATRPLCLLVGSNWPHVPWPDKPDGLDPAALPLPAGSVDTTQTRLWRAKYAEAVVNADKDLGVIYDAAHKALRENLIFLFSSDHGAQWPFAKWNCYEAGVRVPLIVSWPGIIKPNTRSEAMVSWVDFLPTLIHASGGTSPGTIDGRSFLPVLRGEKKDHRDRIFTTHTGDGQWNIYPIRSLREGRWKYIRNLHPEFAFTTHIDLPGKLGQRPYFSTWEQAALNDKHAAEIVQRYHARPADELYDLDSDPHEQHNLAAEPAHAQRLKAMQSTLANWMRDQGDQETVAGKPRLLSDPASYGPNAPSGDEPAKPASRK
jgi:N-sulfoglucosamine sulfohydrolase